MAEPLATSVIASLPRHISGRGSFLRVVKTPSRPSFSANFFTPTPRETPTRIDSPPLESVLDYRTWAYPISKPSLWREDGLMRSLLLSELSPQKVPGHRPRRTPQTSRLRSRKAASLRFSADRLSFSTSPAVCSLLKSRPHIPLSLRKSDPRPQFLELINHRATSQQDLQLALEAYTSAKNEDAFSQMSPKATLELAESLATFIDHLCMDQVNLEVIKAWGQRLQEILEYVPSGSSSVSLADPSRMSLLSRASSFMGHFRQAETFFHTLYTSHGSRIHLESESDLNQAAYESFILSMQRHEGIYSALTYMFTKNLWFSSSFRSSELLSQMMVKQTFSTKEFLALSTKWNQSAYNLMIQEIINAFNFSNAFDKSLEVIDDQYSNNLKVPAYLLLLTAKGLASMKDLKSAQRLFELVPRTEWRSELCQWVKLFLLSRAKDFDGLEIYLDELDGRTLQDREISAFLYPYAVQGKVPDIHRVFERFFPKHEGRRTRVPNIYHYTQVVQAHAQIAVINGIDELLAEMQDLGVQPNIQMMTNIMGIYRKKGDTLGVLNTYQYMRNIKMKLDPILCTVIIGHLAEVRDSKNATQVYMQAIEDGIDPDDKMINALMNVYVETGSLNEAVAIFHHLTSLDAERLPGIDTFSTMLKGYVLIGAPFRLISKLFLRLQATNLRPNSHTYSTLVLSAIDAGELEIARGIYDEMKHLQDSGQSRNLINAHVPTILMSAYLQRRDMEQAKEILDEMTERGYRPTPATYRALINSYGHESRTDWEASMQVAEDFVKELQGQDDVEPHTTRRAPLVHYYSPLIINYCRKGNITEVERLYNEYLDAGGEPTNLLLQHLLRCYGLVGDTQSAMDIWEIMMELADSREVYTGVENDANNEETMKTKLGEMHYPLSMYTDIVSRAGLHDKIMNTWTDMQSRSFTFDSHNWNHLVVALVRAGKVHQAFNVAESVILRRGRQLEVAAEELKATEPEEMELEDKLKIPAQVSAPEDPEFPLRDLRRRLKASNSKQLAHSWVSELTENDEAIAADFSYPLQILQIIPPQWSRWRLHALVLRTLLVAVLQLQRGYSIRPTLPGELIVDNVSASDLTRQNFQETQALLKDLYKNFPQTMEKVHEFHAHETRRLTADNFDKIYMLR